jgi:hypothetical protein
VEFEVGPVRKQARIVGNRFWVRGLWGANMSAPEPFTEMPLVWERASGGWDRSHVDPEFHTCDKRNPFGVGFQRDFGPTQDQIPLPNIEDVNDPVTTLGRRTKPCGFGFINPDWEPRASYAGTYDKDWIETKMPLLPDDFDLRFFNAASPGLITSGYLAGNEQVFVRNCGKEEKLEFELPGAPAPSCRFRIAKQQDVQLTGNLDTVVVNVAEETVTLTYRCHVPLALGFDRLREVQITPHQ